MTYIKVFRTSECACCGSSFEHSDARTKYCSHKCKNSHNSKKFRDRHLGSRYLYLSQLVRSRSNLSVEILEELFQKQGGKCALSGMPMTYLQGVGKIHTNISIDRIKAGGEYTSDNIRLVCCIVNTMRLNLPDEDFFSWCEMIIKHKEKEHDRS